LQIAPPVLALTLICMAGSARSASADQGSAKGQVIGSE
jgi:hypothetical protein